MSDSGTVNQPAMTIAPDRLDSADARTLIRQLDDELRRRYPDIPDHALRAVDASHPDVAFLVARIGPTAVGCGALRPLEPGVGEVKRMFVLPEYRGRGIARAILAALEAVARERGYAVLRLETGNLQPEAINLYRSAGFAQIPPFGEFIGNPVSVCFEKRLT